MQIRKASVCSFSIAMLLSMAHLAYAESAPVYDVDSMPPQQFEASGGSSSQDLPMPPAPEQEGPLFSSNPAAVLPEGKGTAERLRRLEQQLNNLQNSESASHIESLQDQVQQLRGQVEELNHQLQETQKEQKRLAALAASAATANLVAERADQDKVKSTASTKPVKEIGPLKTSNQEVTAKAPASAAITADETETSKNQPNAAEEQRIYQTAYNLIKAKKYDAAVTTLQDMLKKYPSGQFASNAHYWLGELYGLMGKNDQALTEFNLIVSNYRSSPRLSDAQLKIGLIYAAQSQWSDAKAAFKKVINRYPGTASARLASEHLKQIRQAGN